MNKALLAYGITALTMTFDGAQGVQPSTEINSLLEDRRVAVSRAVEHITAATKEVALRTMRTPTESLPLEKVSKEPPESWVRETSCLLFLRELWIASGTYDRRDADAVELFGTPSKITPAVATNALVQTAAFARLVRGEDLSVWQFLKERAKQEPNVTDLAIVGWLMWGEKYFPLVPSDKDLSFDPLATQNRTGAGVALPESSKENWLSLLSGKNGLYRWLAINRMATWVDAVTDEVLYSASFDDYLIVRDHWRWIVARLPPQQRVRMCEDYFREAHSRRDKNQALRLLGEKFDADVQTLYQDAKNRIEREREPASSPR